MTGSRPYPSDATTAIFKSGAGFRARQFGDLWAAIAQTLRQP